MGSDRRYPGCLESLVSFSILAILLLIGLGVFLKQFRYKAIQAISPEISANQDGVGTALDSLAIDGFKVMSAVKVYDAEKLYENINGKAPLYLEAGFEKLSVKRLMNVEDENLWLEVSVYDMGGLRNAFAIYSVQKRVGVEALADERFGYSTGNGAYAVHGRYYIEITGSLESGVLLEAISDVYEKIKSGLQADENFIAELELFPKENLIGDSIKLYLKNTFGFGGLTNTFAAKYRMTEQEVTAFISKRDSAEDAAKIADSYSDFLIENGGTVKSAFNGTAGEVIDFYGTTEIVFSVGTFTAGVHEAEDQQVAEKIAAGLFERLKQNQE